MAAIECLSAGILFADIACAPIDRLPNAGELVATERMQLGLGGCATNTAVDLVKVGVRVGVSGCVGDDYFGRFLIEALGAEGVATDGIHRIPGMGTASTMIVNVKGQDRRFISTPGANTVFNVAHIPEAWVRQARVFYVGGYLMMPGLETDEFVELLRTARAGGAKTVLDVVLMSRERLWEKVSRVLPEVDVFLPNDHEGALITGLDDPLDQAQKFHDAGARVVVITRGSEGSLLVSDRLRLRAGVYPVEFVGGAGSGDAFDAGFIAGMLAGEDLAGCLRWGSALGASCVRAIGTTESVFTRPEAEAFMKTHELPIEEIP